MVNHRTTDARGFASLKSSILSIFGRFRAHFYGIRTQISDKARMASGFLKGQLFKFLLPLHYPTADLLIAMIADRTLSEYYKLKL